MSNPELEKSIKLTQELLGKYVKKPPLSDKNLARPPFRFLHDITTSIHNSSGFLNGVFEASELDPNNITTREGKTEFMRKLIEAIKNATGEEIPVKISKILSGQEPEKTNQMLQSLAKAIAKSGGSKDKLKTTTASTKPAAADTKAGPGRKSLSEKKVDTKPQLAKDAKTKTGAVKKASTTGPNNSKDVKGQPSRGNAAVKASAAPKTKTSEESKDNAKVEKVPITDNVENANTGEKKVQKSTIQRQNSKINLLGQIEDMGENSSDTKNSLGSQLGELDVGNEHDDHIELYNDFKNASMKPNLEALSLPVSPIISESPAMLLPENSSIKDMHEDVPDLSPSIEKSVMDGERGSGDSAVDGKFNSSEAVVASTSRNRPGKDARISTARPPSARPAPPRPRSSLLKDTEESNYRPSTGKVTNVLMDSSDPGDDDDNFIIRETNVSKGLGLADLDEAPELALTGGNKGPEVNLDDLNPGQRGLLVNQILETQKELENKNLENPELGGQDFGFDKSRTNESSKAEIEKLKNLLQECARNANPLGKLLDYVREDIDAMQKEVTKWREESRQLDTELEKAKSVKEEGLNPLQQELNDVETRIADKEDAISATKMAILRHQERIEKILSGLDRVQSSHGKLSLPTASQLMQSEPISVSNDDQENGSYSSGFGTTLNRLATSNSSMRPISLFATADDLDPDNFDPWKS